MEKGYQILCLHAHLPYVRHPEYEYFLEENWLFEAISETYLPLLAAFDRLEADGVPFRVTMSLTPPLMSMLADPLLQERYAAHLDRLIELADRETIRTRFTPDFRLCAEHYATEFRALREMFTHTYGPNLNRGFRRFLESGQLEIITCTATHGFLPLMAVNPVAVEAQIRVAADTHAKHMGRPPRGIWLAECGYYEGHDEVLARHGIEFFFTDTHGILHARPRPKYGVFAPLYTPARVACFGRDLESSRAVWSAEVGYPGHPDYREFYRDIGFDLDFDYVKDYIHPDGIRINTGFKYYRITGRTADKAPYHPERARAQAALHALDFYAKRAAQVEGLTRIMDRKPVVVSPYDAELYGHWWYEGPVFLEALLRRFAAGDSVVRTVTPAEYLGLHPRNQVARPSASSWGRAGYGEVWLNHENDWIYRYLIECSDRMVELATRHGSGDVLIARALNQAARELLLAQSSDWPFIITHRTMVPYAEKRVRQHITRFIKLYNDIRARTVDADWLSHVEYIDNIFPDIDYRIYREKA